MKIRNTLGLAAFIALAVRAPALLARQGGPASQAGGGQSKAASTTKAPDTVKGDQA